MASTDVPIGVPVAATFPSVASVVLASATDVPEEVLIALVTTAAPPIEVPMAAEAPPIEVPTAGGAAAPSVVIPNASAGAWPIPLATTADVAIALIATTQSRSGCDILQQQLMLH